jgi:acyl transferase domain-containing protein/enoyl-CoA hydratase/carnithine racemase/acyl carrier protein
MGEKILIHLTSLDQTFGFEKKQTHLFPDNSPVKVVDNGGGIFCIKVADDVNQNLLSETIMDGLEKSFTSVREQKNLKAVLLMGGEQCFLSGKTTEKEKFFARKALLLPLTCDVPVIAVMKGHSTGLGWLLGAVCDFMMCSEESSYQYFSQDLNWQPCEEELLLFEARFGKDFASEFLFSSRNYTGLDLREKGFGMPILPKDKIDSYALAFAHQLVKAPGQSLGLLKKHLSQEIAHRARKLLSSFTPISKKTPNFQAKQDVFYEDALLDLGSPKIIKMDSDVVRMQAYHNGIVLVTLCDKENKNTFSDSFVQGVKEAFAKIEKSSEYKVVILTGYDHYFACGGTKEGLLAIQKGETKFTDVMIYSLALECKIPVIAAMQGHGIGAGWSMGMFCDHVLFSKESIYLSPYMRYGFTPGAGATLIFPKKFGMDLGREILFTANEYKGEELRQRGMKMPLLTRAEIQDYALKMATKMALVSREELIQQKTERCSDLRHSVAAIYDQELAMHEESFVNNEEVFQRIQNNFNEIQRPKEIESLPQISDEAISKQIRERLRVTLAEELHMTQDMIDDELAFIDMGLDSIIGVTWVRKINTEYGLSIPATKVYSHPTIAQFTQYVMHEGRKQGLFQPNNKVEEVKKIESVQLITSASSDEGISKQIRERLRVTLAEELHMTQDMIDEELAFIDMGLDSIIGVTWVRKINTEYGLSIPATKVYSHPTIAQLTQYVMHEGKKQGLFQPSLKEPTFQTSQEKAFEPTRKETGKKVYPILTSLKSGMLNDPTQILPVRSKEEKPKNQAIAVIGMSGQFPKSKNLDEFWDNLMHGRDCVSDISPERWNVDEYYDPNPQAPGKTHCKWMGALEDVAQFDPLFFNISPSEAELMDPQQRLFLQSIWHCIEDAAYNPFQLSGSRCGVFVGCGVSDYSRLLKSEELSAKGFTGASTSILAARISYLLNLQGPCISIDTACSSSLVAIAAACDSLVLGNSDLALAGGVCVLAGPSVHIMASKAGMLSEDGRCFSFDQRANGFVPGEGVGVVFLKRLEEAERDGDQIYGVIRGWGVNQDGKTNGITAPNPDSQARLEKEIYDKYGINPENIQLVETHGTGTKLGDPIEVEGLEKSFKSFTTKENYCALGSVKSNIGHLLTAAGIAGTIKLLLSLKHQKIPPTIHYKQLNEHIELEKSPFYINTECKDWPAGQKRCCAISSFGFSGTNSHLVIEEYMADGKQTEPVNASHPAIIVLSAKNQARLMEYAKSLLKFIQSNPKTNLANLAYTFQVGREAMDERLGIVVYSMQMLEEKLQEFIEGKEDVDDLCRGQVKKNKEALTAFTTDMGNTIDTWIAKGKYRELLELWVKGLNFDWNRLYQANKPQRISAPTYPFAKERYWVDTNASSTTLAIKTHLHPLLHKNNSSFNEQRFCSTLTGEEFFLRDHQVQGQKVLPGVAYLEMAHAAFSQSMDSLPKNNECIALKNVVWARPITVDEPTKITIELFPSNNGEIGYEIYTDKNAEGNSVVHSQGVAFICSSNNATRLNLADLQVKLNKSKLDRQTCYETFDGMGLNYGPAHQSIERIYVGEKAVLAKLSLPTFLAKTKNQFSLHPSLLDGALQASIGLSLDEKKRQLALPFALERLDILHACAESMWAWVRYAEGSVASNKVQKLDIDLCDEEGLVCIKMRGFTSRLFDATVLDNSITSSIEVSEIDEKAFEKKVITYFKKQLSKVLKLPIQEIQAEEPFEKYGIDSIIVMQLTAELEKTFGSLSKTLFFEYQTVQEISEYFLTSYRPNLLKILDFNSTKQIADKAEASVEKLTSPKKVSPSFHRSRKTSTNQSSPHEVIDIAIIGLSGKYPQSDNLEEYWRNLRDGKDCIIEVPKERWDWRDYYKEDRSGRHYSKWGGFIADVDKFDPLFFNIAPREAEFIDPQERLFLEHVWAALEDAGYTRNDLQGKIGEHLRGQVGVYAGVMYGHYQLFGAEENLRGNPISLGNSYASIANRVSYFLNLHGPSMTVDTMCSSSLTTMHLACQDLKLGRTNLGIVGGVNLSIHPNKYLDLSMGQFISGKGRCESFGEGGEGYIPGEGVGVALLKRLSEAERDGDHIYGIIKGSMLNHGGKTNGYTVPNPNAQQEVISWALKESQIDPEMISYIEAHGTGTKLGDPIEITGLTKAFAFKEKKTHCWIGSAKSNIGHCESAAGIAGVTKVLLQMKNKQIAPSLHSKVLNPNIDFSSTPFIVNQELRDWERPIIDGKEYPRIAGISSFGAGGSNAHMVIEEYIADETLHEPVNASHPAIIVLSAKNQTRLTDYAKSLLKFIQNNPNTHLANLAYTFQVGREAMDERLGIIISSMQMLEEKLQEFIVGKEDVDSLYRGNAKQNKEALTVFTSDDDMVNIIDTWIVKGKYRELLELWVKGLNFDWNRLYQANKPQRISAPTYPFAKERYWVETKGPSTSGTMLTVKTPQSPLLDENFPSIATLMFKPIWKASPIDSGENLPVYTAHHVFLCGLKQLQIASAEMTFITLQSNQTLLEKRFVDYSVALFEHIQTLLVEKPKGPVLLQVVVPDHGPERMFASLSGLLKTAHLENPKILGQVIMIGQESTEKELIGKLQESIKRPQEQQIHYKSDKRFVMSFAEEISFQSEVIKEMPWREGGVYLITGGMGGLGLLFAKEIAEQTKHATVVVTGRSKLTADKQAQLEELKSLGIKLEYKAVDVCDKAAVENLIYEIEKEIGQLNGIIHSAGVIKDNFILKKNKEEFTQVLLPKVEGVVNLDQATQDLKHLDFFILFSSGAGAMGNVGQADYATANAFLDAFAHERQLLCDAKKRSGQTLSINWPLWKSGGMSVNQATEQMMRESIGMVPMQTASGMAAFYLALSLKQPQMIVVEGYLQQLREKLLIPVKPIDVKVNHDQSKINTNDFIIKIQNVLLQTVSELLKIKSADLDVNTELSEYGFDSISLTEFSNKLNQKYKLELTPTIFFEYLTIESLATHLNEEYQTLFARHFSTNTQAEPVLPAKIELNKSPEIKSGEELQKPIDLAQFSEPLLASETKSKTLDPIAIVGISGRFPMARDIDEFWHNLENEKSCISEIPKDRWDWEKLYGNPKTEMNKTNVKWGGFIDGIGEFDPLFFNISPREAELMDPQQRLLMTYAWLALEDSAHLASSLSGGNTGIFVGTASSSYSDLIAKAKTDIESYSSTGTVASMGPNRMSYFLNIHGPSEPVETACSSSLVAIHKAILAIEAGDCDQAIVGGINTIITPDAHINFNKAGMLCQDGRCKTFSKQADGYVRSEGVGMLVLKKLKAAEADGDHIYGLIRGSAQNHGGRANSLTAPNPKAQADLLVSAYKKAGIDPRTVGYIEAHGTGTELGDPIEINGLKSAFKKLYLETGDSQINNAHCGLGSVKTNIGHLEIAAGVSGVIKVLLQLKHKKLVKSLHCDEINPYIDLTGSSFYLVNQSQEWQALRDSSGKTLPRRAGVSSFGFGGSNAHIVIEEYIPTESQASKEKVLVNSSNPVVIVLSAKNRNRLNEYAEKLLKFIQGHSEINLADLAYTFQVGREAMEERLGLIIHSKQELEENLRNFIEKKIDINNLYHGQVKQNKDTLSILSTDNDMAKAIDAWMTNRKYHELLSLWVKGLNVDWNKLYKNKPRRISAPTYPFSRDNYWIETIDSQKTENNVEYPLHKSGKDCLSINEEWQAVSSKSETKLWTKKIEAKKEHRILVISEEINDYDSIKSICQTIAEISQNLESLCHIEHLAIDDEMKELDLEPFIMNSDLSQAIFLFLPTARHGLELASTCVQSIRRLATRNQISLYCCYLEQPSDASLYQEELLELFKSAKLENPKHRYRSIAYDAKLVSEGQIALRIIEEWLCDETENALMVRYAKGERFELQVGFDNYKKEKFEQEKHTENYVLEKCWNPLNIGSKNTIKFQDAVLILVNKDSLTLANALIKIAAIPEDSIVILNTSIKENQQFTSIVDFQNHASCEQFAKEIMHHDKKITCMIDLSDLYQIAKDKDHDPYGKIVFYQNIIAASYSELSILYFTKGLQSFQSKEMSLAGAKFAGLVKMLSVEYKHVKSIAIDIDDSYYHGEGLATIIRNELQTTHKETEVCYRELSRFVPYVHKIRIDRNQTGRHLLKSFTICQEGVYVISGGTGGIGLKIADYLIERGARYLVLMGKTRLPPKDEWKSIEDNLAYSTAEKNKVAALVALEKKGCLVEVYVGDLQDYDAMSHYFEKIRVNRGAIKGVIHSATSSPKDSDNPLFINKDLKEFRSIYEAKVNGFEHLQMIFNNDPLDFFVSFSSTAGQIPYFMRGFSSYGMANSFLDYVTNYQISKGLSYFRSIAWVGWTDVGMNTRNKSLEATQRYTRKLGLLFNNSKEGIELFEGAMMVDSQNHNLLPCLLDEACFDVNKPYFYTAVNSEELLTITDEETICSKIKAFENGQLSKRQFAGFLKALTDNDYTESIREKIIQLIKPEDGNRKSASTKTNDPLNKMPEVLADKRAESLSRKSVINDVEKTLSEQILDELEKVLKIKKSDFDWDQSFQGYGLDSISGIQLATRLEKKFNFPIQPRWFIEYSTLNRFTYKLSQESQKVN